jgi:uncharacterized membrane protein YfcA
MMDWYLYPLMIIAGFAAGFINTLAGSGSIVTLPLLLYLGLPANMANATNRINVIFQNITGSVTFYRGRMLDIRAAAILGAPAVLGSILGAMIAVSLDEKTMRMVIGCAMVMMAILILFKSDRWITEHVMAGFGKPKWWHMILMFVLGIYAGFIQLGVGVFILITLVMGIGFDTRHANAIKVGIILIVNLAAMVVFQGNNQINWTLGLIVAVGSMLGAWVAARYAIHWNPKWIYRLLILVVIVTAMDLLGVFKLLGTFFTHVLKTL